MNPSTRGLLAAGPWALLVGLVAGTALPCGPFLPNQLLLHATRATLDAPPADLMRALVPPLLPPPQRLPFVAPGDQPDQVTIAAELADIQTILPPATHALAPTVAANLQAARTAPPAEREALLRDVPAEFRLYTTGAAAFRAHDLPGARAAWQAALALPPEQRRLRSTWAAFMLGKAALLDQPAAAPRWFADTRALAAQGYADRLGLALTSLGWEARAHTLANTPAGRVAALALYVQQAQHGQLDAVVSTRLAARAVATDPAAAQLAAAKSETRQAVTAWLLGACLADSEPKPADFALARAWLDAVTRAAPAPTEGADRLAWLAYRAGQFADAKRWLTVAVDAPMANWLRAKLALKAGDIAVGTALLRKAVPGLPQEPWTAIDFDSAIWAIGDLDGLVPRAKATAELGLLALGRREFVEAFALLLRSGYWLDAAWVGERVLTVEELQAWVDKNAKTSDPKAIVAQSAVDGDAAVPQTRVRDLLGRRLVRLGRVREALPYLQTHVADAKALAAALADGRDPKKSQADQALGLWRAAQLTRQWGMELAGLEAEPDWHVVDGEYAMASAAAARATETGLGAASPQELARAQANAAPQDQRFHYRNTAADLALAASALLPDTDPRAPVMLCWAAHWLYQRQPVDKYFNVFRQRFGHSPLLAHFPNSCPPPP